MTLPNLAPYRSTQIGVKRANCLGRNTRRKQNSDTKRLLPSKLQVQLLPTDNFAPNRFISREDTAHIVDSWVICAAN